MQTEMMSEAIDDSLDNDEAEEETEELTNQVISAVLYFSVEFHKWKLIYNDDLLMVGNFLGNPY